MAKPVRNRLKIEIKNADDKSGELELYFTDDIYDDFDWNTFDYENMVQDTIDKIKNANPKKITLVINSLGGDVMIGLAIYNFLKDYPAQVDAKIIGFAASIASVIAMAASNGGKVYMAKNSFMIIHNAWGLAIGNAAEMREQADILDNISENIADIYAQKTGKKTNEIVDLMSKGDYWMDGESALEQGFVDELISTEIPVQASVNPKSLGFNNVPESIMKAFDKKEPESKDKPKVDNTFFSQIKELFMDFKKHITAALEPIKNDEANAGSKDLLESILNAMADAGDKFQGEIESEIVDKLKEVNDKIDALEIQNKKYKDDFEGLKNELNERSSGGSGYSGKGKTETSIGHFED